MVEFWTAALGLSPLLYVLLDGFDLGVGMLFPFAPDEHARRHMLASISPVWDGNETWLVVAAAILFGAFPLVYSIAISAFYLPILLMLASLILRGVAFEFRYKAGRTMRRVVRRDVRAGRHRRRVGGRPADPRAALHRRAAVLGPAAGADLRGGPLHRLRVDGLVLADGQDGRPPAGVRLPHPAGVGGGAARVPHGVAGYLALPSPAGDAPLGGAPRPGGVPAGRAAGDDRHRLGVEGPARPRPVPVRGGDLRLGLRHDGGVVSALHGAVLHHHRPGRRAGLPACASCSGAPT